MDLFTIPRMKIPPCTSEFTQRLSAAIKTSGQSIGDVAKAAGLGGRQSLHPYLTGRVEPTLKRVEQLAKVLHVDRRWLAGWQDKGGPKGSRSPLDDDEWEQAITALYRYAARQALGDLPSDPEERRALLRRSAKEAGHAAYCGYRHLEKPDGWEGDFPTRKHCYKINTHIFLNAASGEVARICMYTGREGVSRMRVMPPQA